MPHCPVRFHRSRLGLGSIATLLATTIWIAAPCVAQQMTFQVNGEPAGGSLAVGNRVTGTITFDDSRLGYIGVETHCLPAGEERSIQIGRLYCQPKNQDRTTWSVHPFMVAAEPVGMASPLWRLEQGDTLVLKLVDAQANVLATARFAIQGTGGAASSQDAPEDTDRPSVTDLLERGNEEIVGVSVDPSTGQLRVSRRLPDGTVVSSVGRVTTDEDGNVRITETDTEGNQRETTATPEGIVTTALKNADLSRSTTTAYPDGSVVRREKSADGYTTVNEMTPDGSVTETTYGLDDKADKVVTRRPDGWTVTENRDGSLRKTFTDADGVTTNVEVDHFGQTRTTRRAEDGELLAETRGGVHVVESGRDYYERILGGTGWADLPEESKTYYADKSAEHQVKKQHDFTQMIYRLAEEREERLAQEANEQARREMEAKFAAEQAEAERRLAAETARAQRQQQIDDSWDKARDLRRQFADAVENGDEAEASRIAALQDDHAKTTMDLLRHTDEEQQEMQRLADMRSDLSSRVAGRARALAESKIAELNADQDAKANTTDKTRWVSMGSQMQQSTDRTTRMANATRAYAGAKVNEIDRMLADDDVTGEERVMLTQMRQMAIDQRVSAQEMLASNGRITAMGYATDAGLILTGGKVFQGAKTGAKWLASKAFSQPTAARVGSVVAERGLLELAGKGVTRAATTTTAKAAGAEVALAVERAFSTDLGAKSADAARRLLGERVTSALATRASQVGEVLATDVTELGKRLASRGENSAVLSEFGTNVAERTQTMTAAEHEALIAAIERDRLKYLAETQKLPEIAPPSGDPAATLLPHQMTKAQRQAYNDGFARAAIDQQHYPMAEAIVGSDILPVPVANPPKLVWSADDLVRLHQPGRALSRADIHLKAELYAQRETARTTGIDLFKNGGSAEEIAYWRDRFQHFNKLIEDAKAAAGVQ